MGYQPFGFLYSYFLSLVLTVFGGNLLLARIFQIVLGAVSCALACGVFTKCFGQRVGGEVPRSPAGEHAGAAACIFRCARGWADGRGDEIQ